MKRRVKCGRCLRVLLVPIDVRIHFHRCVIERARPAPRLETEEEGRERFAEILAAAKAARESKADPHVHGATARRVYQLTEEGLNQSEIARTIGISRQTVAYHLARR